MARMGPNATRRLVATGLVVVAVLLAVGAHLTLWADRVALDEAGFVDALAPLSDDDEVTDALAASLTTRILALFEDGDPGDLSSQLAGVFGEGAERLVRSTLVDTFRSDVFDDVWRAGLERAHADFMDSLGTSGTEVTLLVTDVLARTDQALEDQGIDVFDDEAIEELSRVTLLQDEQVARVRRVLDAADGWGPAIRVGFVAATVAALVVAPDRRRALVALGVGIAAGVLLAGLLVDRSEGRALAEADPADRVTGEAAWAALTDPLDDQARLVVLGAGAVAVLAAGAGLLQHRRSRAAHAPTF
jgi:hypothetical protein